MSDSYDDYEAKMQLAEHAWEKRVVKTEHDRAVELGKAYERGWNAALAQREWVWLTEEEVKAIANKRNDYGLPMTGRMWVFVADLTDKLKEKNHG